MVKTNQNRTGRNRQNQAKSVAAKVDAAVNKAVSKVLKAKNLKGSSRKGQGPKNPPKGPKSKKPKNQNKQIRNLNDVPLGNSQKNGFNRNSGSKIVTKDEYIGEVAGTSAFTTTQYAVNPGQTATFPWLAKEALQWEKYEFVSLEFYLKPEVTQYNANAAQGKVILSFDSDASDPPPLNKQEAEDVMPMADGMPYQTVTLNIPKFILHSHLDAFYVRPGNLPGSSDIKTYDLGNLFVSTTGQVQAVPMMMELRVKYTCKLMIPILENIAAAPQNNQVSLFQSAAPQASGITTVAATMLLATVSYNGINAVNTTGSIVLPAGNYLLDASNTAKNATQADQLVSTLDLQYNGVSLFVTTPIADSYTSTYASGNFVYLSGSMFVQSNGILPITLVITNTYGGGVVTNYATLRITAV
jgi:hypothetical protein